MNVCHLLTGLWDITRWKVGSLSRRSQRFNAPTPCRFCRCSSFSKVVRVKHQTVLVWNNLNCVVKKTIVWKIPWRVAQISLVGVLFFFKQNLNLNRCPLVIQYPAPMLYLQRKAWSYDAALTLTACRALPAFKAFQRILCMPVFIVRPW